MAKETKTANAVSQEFKKLIEKGLLLTGTDSGNRAQKITYLDNEGNVKSFTIPTVVARTDITTRVDDIQSSGMRDNKEKPGEATLHLKIESPALTKENRVSYWFVGEFAQNRKGKTETEGTEEQKYKNEKHIITTLAGLATAAFKTGREKVNAPYSGGLPMEEYKKYGDQLLNSLKGTHIVEAISGTFAGKKVEIEITDGLVQVEGMASSLALTFDIKNGEIIETEFASRLENNFGVGDLGAGTNDYALFADGEIDDSLTYNTTNGTNKIIDEMLLQIKNHEEFQDYKARLEKAATAAGENKNKITPYPTRESFVREVIEPEILKLIESEAKGEEYSMKFLASWGRIRDVDVTEIVLPLLTKYGEETLGELDLFWSKAVNAEAIAVVGGGLLFGWITFRNHKDEYVFPAKIEEAAYFTSKSYLISSYGNELEKLAIAKK